MEKLCYAWVFCVPTYVEVNTSFSERQTWAFYSTYSEMSHQIWYYPVDMKLVIYFKND